MGFRGPPGPRNLRLAAAGLLQHDGQRLTTSATLQPGKSTQTVMLRPEQLHLGTIEGENHLKGKVDQIAFLGSVIRLMVTLGEAIVTLDVLNERGQTLPKVGEEVGLSFPPHACWVLPEP